MALTKSHADATARNNGPRGVVVFARDAEFHYPAAIRWEGHRRVGDFETSDLDVYDASGKVIATFQSIYWSSVEFAR